MEPTLLIDAIVRQTTVLIAQLATSAGVRAPLAHTANQVFLDLVGQLKEQGLGNNPDGATCSESRYVNTLTQGFNTASAAVTAVSKGTAEFDDAAATACLTALSQVGCNIDFWIQPTIPAPCAAVFSGHVSDGGTCIDDVECARGSMCIIASTETCTGTCTPAGSAGCRMNTDCPADQYCAGVAWAGPGFWSSGTCSPLTLPGVTAGDVCGNRFNARRDCSAWVDRRLRVAPQVLVRASPAAPEAPEPDAHPASPAHPATTARLRLACRKQNSAIHARHCSSAAHSTG